jgi:putative FmdB family regulatory protein
MPLYEYICDTCHTHFEVRKSFSDDSIPACPHCNGTGKVRKVFSAPAIVFKGSGFYVTDARGKNSATKPAASRDTADHNGAAKSNGTDASKKQPEAKKSESTKTG